MRPAPDAPGRASSRGGGAAGGSWQPPWSWRGRRRCCAAGATVGGSWRAWRTACGSGWSSAQMATSSPRYRCPVAVSSAIRERGEPVDVRRFSADATAVLDSLGDRLPPGDQDSLRTYLGTGEWGLLADELAAALLEDATPISPTERDLVRELLYAFEVDGHEEE